jgi:hypothetical protein
MKLKEVKSLLKTNNLLETSPDAEELEVINACGADLMSDVLAFSKEKTLLLTGLTNPQVVRTAEMVGIQVIIFVRGKQPQVETITLADQLDIFIYSTEMPLFEACGILYKYGIGPEDINYL